MFSSFAKWIAIKMGRSRTFVFAILLVVIWLLTGPFYHFSDTWQLVINTTTTIITFLMVFLIQNTQNRDSTAVHIKLDEIIRAMEMTHNQTMNAEELSDKELEDLLESYKDLSRHMKERIKRGLTDKGVFELKDKKK